MDVRAQMLVFQDFEGPDRSFGRGSAADVRGTLWARKLSLWADFSFLKPAGWKIHRSIRWTMSLLCFVVASESLAGGTDLTQAVLDGVPPTLKVRKGAFDALNKGCGALGK